MLKNFIWKWTFLQPWNIIQLLTIEAVDMMWYRPENNNIDWGEAEVNIGILWSISHHIHCLDIIIVLLYNILTHPAIYPSSKVHEYMYIERQISGRASVTLF